jgi:AcrR family transcriptional regulator
MASARTPLPRVSAIDAAIELFSRQGYEQTTVEEIADAAQISRATFFRRYRSKEDVVFADHERLLERVTDTLTAARMRSRPDDADADAATSPFVEVCHAARLVFDHHLGQRDTSLARYRLLQKVPALRDRELVTAHRYERLFTTYLRDALPPGRCTAVQSVAFPAAVVAVHNAILRRWLREPHRDARDDLAEAFEGLLHHVQAGGDGHRQAQGTGSAPAARVVVVEVEPGATADAVADAVRTALR